jgi:hypothetical protein
MKAIFILLISMMTINIYCQDNRRVIAYKGTLEYSNGSDTRRFYGFEALTGCVITKLSVRDASGNIVTNAITTLINKDGGEIKVGGLYVLPVGYIGDTLTVTGSIKKLLD